MTTRKPAPPTRIVKRGRGHSYYLDGGKVPGVTTIIGKGIPKPQFIDSAVRDAANYVNDNWDELQTMKPSERFEAIRSLRWTKLQQGGERGREVHEYVRRYLAGEDIAPPEDLADLVDAGIAFERDWKVRELAVECAVFSREFGYGGRFDLLAELADKRTWLLDWKTTLSGVWPESALQLAGYRYADFYVVEGDLNGNGALVERPMPTVDQCGVVHLRADGYDLYPLEADADAAEIFAAAQIVYGFVESSRDDWIGDALRPPEEPS